MRSWLILTLALSLGCFEAPPLFGEIPGDGGTGGTGAAGGGGGAGAGGEGSGALPVCTTEVGMPCTTVEHIWAGGTFTCAGMGDGTVRCFGHNDSGQLGDPQTPSSRFSPPVIVEGVSAAAQITLGNRHACAVEAGELTCWGRNTVGQLGTGDLHFSDAPRENLVNEPVDQVVTYHSATCVRLDGTVRCWGHALNGQVWSNADTGDRQLTPAVVPGLDDVVDIGISTLSACALESDNSLWCWGVGVDGALGNGSTDGTATPTRVAASLESPVHHLALGGAQTCVVAGDPAVVQCWGALPTIGAVTTTPTTLSTQPSGAVADLQSGHRHACALLEDGRVQCWGRNANGQLGTGGPQTESPTSVVGVDDAVELALGTNHVCALRAGGEMVCWGNNAYGQLGTTDGADQGTPQLVPWNP